LLPSCFDEEYFWSRWNKGSRGSSMEDILSLDSWACSSHVGISSLYTCSGFAETLMMQVVTIRQPTRDVHFPGATDIKWSWNISFLFIATYKSCSF
jgi:hypothetical protein